MRDWAQWLVDHNMRYLLISFYLLSIPVAAIILVMHQAIEEAIVAASDIPRMIKDDMRRILDARKGE